jgi:hypothetical protein
VRLKPGPAIHDTRDLSLFLEALMRALVRPFATSLFLAGTLASLAAQAQTPPEQPYQAQPEQGYQQPQQQYQQPPQAYPQQQYQQYPQYQQQGYAQPQAYPSAQGYPANQPPPGYYAPQPAYRQPTYHQPAYAPAPTYAAEPPYRVGFLWMPYIGVNIPTGDLSDSYSAGLRLGGIFGINLPPFLSLNLELTFDWLNPKYADYDTTEIMYSFSFSPLFHFRFPQLELVAGPKFGYFGHYVSFDQTYDTSSDFTESGYAYGINLGIFFPLGRLSIGGLLNYTGHHVTSSCNVYNECADVYNGADYNLLGFSLALLY